jgi:predicted NAD/FAD-dependent oxidoreductase
MDPVIVIGAGISGVACARALSEAGLAVRVLDRGRRIGGRMASRSVDGRPVDIGASYVTASDPGFVGVVADWQERGLVHPWTDTFSALTGGASETKPGPMRYGAARGLRSLVEDLAAGLDLESGRTVQQVSADGDVQVDGVPASAVVLAMPDPQGARLLDGTLAQERAVLRVDFEPVLALTATFARRSWDLDGAFLNGDPVLDWVADDGRRRGDGAPVLVAHSSSEFAARHLSDPDTATGPMVAALRQKLVLTEPVQVNVHRWTFARPSTGRTESFLLGARNLGVCGDAWSEKPRVEGAYVSGRALGEALAARLTGSAGPHS